jgi:hypothetical protein
VAISAGVGFSCIQCRRIHNALSPLSNTLPFTSEAPVVAVRMHVTAAAKQSAPRNSPMAGVRFEAFTVVS